MKGISLDIYKTNYGDCSNGGVSSTSYRVTLIDKEVPKLHTPDSHTPAVKLVRRMLGGKEYIHAEPVEPCPAGGRGYMHGGCYVATSDSRVNKAIGHQYPISLHDRVEYPQTNEGE